MQRHVTEQDLPGSTEPEQSQSHDDRAVQGQRREPGDHEDEQHEREATDDGSGEGESTAETRCQRNDPARPRQAEEHDERDRGSDSAQCR